MIKILITIFVLITSSHSYASSCCGGAGSSSAIILGDNEREFNFALSSRNDYGQSDTLGYSLKNKDDVIDEQQALSFQYSKVLVERVQISIKTSVVQKSIQKLQRQEKSSGLSDIELQSAFEFLPEYTYSPLKPRGFFYGKISIPTSTSIYDSTSLLFSDVRGLGLLAVSAGTLMAKRINQYQFKSAVEFQRLFGKQIGTSRLEDSHRFIIPLSASVTHEASGLTFGVSNTWNYQSPKEMTGTIKSQSQAEYFWDTGFFTNLSINREQSFGVSYNNSAFIGKSVNSSLYQSISLNFTSAQPL